jgi:folate-binding protein YgfZ
MSIAPSRSIIGDLSGLRLLRFTGPDSLSFLQGQLTQDLEEIDGRTVLAACNTPQGRVVATMRLRRIETGFWALVAADLADAVAAHLRRYVLRAKVQILVDRDSTIAARSRGAAATGSRQDEPDAVVFAWGRDREVIVRPASPPPPDVVGGDPVWSAWLAADIAEGLPHVTAATSGHFVAQMLNLDLLDAISFRKGCYTGQEIIARTQNLGRIKRRMLRYRVASGEPPPPLAALGRDGARTGEVLQAARGPDGVELLAVVSLDSRDRPLELADGRAAVPLPLPYDV